MNEQIDIFGGSTPIKDVEAKEKRSIKRLFRKMYGFKHGHLCKDCKNLVCADHHGKRYYKCLLIGLSHSEATDIHLKDIACKRWERKEE